MRKLTSIVGSLLVPFLSFALDFSVAPSSQQFRCFIRPRRLSDADGSRVHTHLYTLLGHLQAVIRADCLLIFVLLKTTKTPLGKTSHLDCGI